MRTRGVFAVALSGAAVTVVAAVAGAAGPPLDGNGGASALAYAVRITIPGQEPIEQTQVTAPPDAAGFQESFQYPADGSVVSTGAVTATVSAASGQRASASAATGVTTLSLFAGELTADSVSGRARATATAAAASGDYAGTGFTNLTVLGQVVPQPAPNQRVPLADWGYAILLEQPPGTAPDSVGKQGYHGFVTALDVHLTADHGGLVAGSEIQVGYAEANAQPARTPQPGVATQPTGPGLPTTTPVGPRRTSRKPPEPNPSGIPPVINQIPRVTPAADHPSGALGMIISKQPRVMISFSSFSPVPVLWGKAEMAGVRMAARPARAPRP